ncbi:hypothetical protein HPB50_024027 [Hyalomma asiaticum]|uniref:Uncharacterized protein n=1 Tax=Hyalomma asiaticum TaxID=266040 RepID=A0ACB7SK91_HYAAI|nr:hypothetical protein HPB50_024027 [Hyalomma asiaticum]
MASSRIKVLCTLYFFAVTSALNIAGYITGFHRKPGEKPHPADVVFLIETSLNLISDVVMLHALYRPPARVNLEAIPYNRDAATHRKILFMACSFQYAFIFIFKAAEEERSCSMAVNIAAVAAVILYCVAVMSVGVWSGRKLHGDNGYTTATDDRKQSFRRGSRAASSNFLLKLFLAEGRLPVLLGIFSMTATWVGGGYLNGTAEAVYSSGIVYCFAPIGYAVSLVLGGSFFAKKMRKAHAITMLDPMQQHYGRWMGLLLCLPAVCGEVFWTAAMLAALGDTAGAIMQVNSALFVVILASIILFYTSLGGYYSVSYTDVLQITSTAVFLVYFQRVLGSDSDYTAKMLSYVAAIGCLFLAMPPAILGAMAKTANLTAAGYPGPAILRDRDRARVLPFSIRYLTSPTLSVLGMIGILAAVMSSVDSSMLSASAMVTWNVYHALIRPKASDREVALMLRVMVCAIGASATYLALSVQSVFNLWILCSDVVYVLLFPQLVCVFYIRNTNTYGSVIGEARIANRVQYL